MKNEEIGIGFWTELLASANRATNARIIKKSE